MAADQIDTRVSLVEHQVKRLDAETERTRARLHRIEGYRATMRLLVRQVADVARQVREIGSQVREIGDSVETIAESAAQRAAERAVEIALDAREEKIEERRRKRLDYRLKLVGTGVAVGGFASTLVALIVTNT